MGRSDFEPDVEKFCAGDGAGGQLWPQRRWSAPSAIAQPPKTGARVAAKPRCACGRHPQSGPAGHPARRRLPLRPAAGLVKLVPVSSTAPALTETAAGAGAASWSSGSRALRQLLVDAQIQQTAKPGPQSNAYFVRLQTMALRCLHAARGLGAADQLQPRLPAAHHSQRGRGARRPAQ